ncbi:GON4L family protein [Megaselia abdita]
MALEYKLQECANNMHLSPVEVRKIIRKIVGNEHILALVKLQEEDDEKKKLEIEETRTFSDSPTKLTRAKMKALNKVDPMLSFVQPLIESEQPAEEPELTALTKGFLHSDEEDEEYEPKEEDLMSDDDPNCTLSDLDSNPRTPMTPYSIDCSPVKCATTPDGVFKVPKQRTMSNSEREEIIAKRTRSKVSLQLIPIESIEAQFQPPDVTSDMYEQPDAFDTDWSEFLGKFHHPMDVSHLEEEHDDDYIPLENVPYDPDDLRDVNVSKKEIDDLFEEIIGAWPINALINTDGNDIESVTTKEVVEVPELNTPPFASPTNETFSYQPEIVSIPPIESSNDHFSKPSTVHTQQPSLVISNEILVQPLSVQEEEFKKCPCKSEPFKTTNKYPVRKYIYEEYVEKYKCLRELKPIQEDFEDVQVGFTRKQIAIVEDQMRIFTQLTTQHFLQTFSHPKFWGKASSFKTDLLDLQKAVNRTSFNVCNLKNAVDLVERWEKDLSEVNEENRKHIEFIEAEMLGKSKSRLRNIMRFPPKVMQAILTEEAFLYPEFVPKMAFRTDQHENAMHDFSVSELWLIAIGLERYLLPIHQKIETNLSSYRTDLKAACERMSWEHQGFVHKKPRRIYEWVQLNQTVDIYNPIQYFFEFNRSPPVKHEIHEYSFEYGITLKDRVDELLPNWKDFSTALNTVEIAKYCGNKSVGNFVGELSEISTRKRNKLGKRIFKEEESPSIIVNINYIFPGCSNPENILQSNILPATPSSSNFVFDWNQGTLFPEVNFNESRFSEISNETINISKNSFNLSQIDISTPIKEKVSKVENRRKSAFSPAPKRKRDCSKNAFSKFIVDYRWNSIHKVLRIFKVPLIYFIAREFKALELYTDLLEDLKMNCKKSETSLAKRMKDSEDDPIPKSKKAARMEENFRHMLMPDTKEEANRKDELYALNYFEKVEDTFKSANKLQEFEQFEEILRTFDISIQPVSSLYKKMETLFLPEYPELAEAFLAFLQPHQAAEVGKFYEHFIENNMRTFINKLNIYFNKQPAQIRKILNTLCELSDDPNVTMEKIKQKVLPLLKGNQFLTDWFLETFPSEKVPDSLTTTPEVVKLKEIESDNNDNYEIIPYSELIPDTSEGQTPCQTKYVNGRIFYGSKLLLPAKLTFIAEEHAKRMKNYEDFDSDHVDDCVHGVREYGESRLMKLMSGDSESTSASVTDESNNLTVDQICDESELKMHAVRLNPTLYSTPSTGQSTSEPLSPKKQITRSYERRKSPKKSVLRSPVCPKKPTDPVASTSPAIAVARKIKVLTNDKPSCSKDLKLDSPEVVPEKVETKCWTREEDKIILEAIRGNSSDATQVLIEKISEKLTTRNSQEIQERHKFLMDVLSKLQSK